jgi:hypothetical protein
MAGSWTKIFSYARKFFFMPAAVRFASTAFSAASPCSQCLMSRFTDVRTRSSVDLVSAARLSITWRGARRNVETTPMLCNCLSERAPQPMSSLKLLHDRVESKALGCSVDNHLVHRITARRRIRMGRLLAVYTGYLGRAAILQSHDLAAADAHQRDCRSFSLVCWMSVRTLMTPSCTEWSEHRTWLDGSICSKPTAPFTSWRSA